MEFYQWLLRGRGLEVSKRGYFVYCNGDRSQPRFDARLRFKIKLIPYDGNDNWVDDTLIRLRQLLESEYLPASNSACDYCTFVRQAASPRQIF
jgi:hypothetical protein